MKQPITAKQQEWLFCNHAVITCGPANHYEVKVRTMPTIIASEIAEAISAIEKIRQERVQAR